MTDRPPSVAHLASPLVVSFWTRAGFALVDAAYAATLGDAALAAIGLAAPFELLIVAAWTGLTNGLTAAIGRSLAAGAFGRAAAYARAGRLLAIALAALFVAAGAAIWLFAPLLPLPGDVRAAFRVYGAILVAGSALTTFWSALPAAVVKAGQDTRTAMRAGILANVANLAANTLFTFGLGWGIAGIALATVIGKLAGLAWVAAEARRLGLPLLPVSAVTGEGLPALKRAMLGLLALAPPRDVLERHA